MTRYGPNHHSITVECYATGVASLAVPALSRAGESERALTAMEDHHVQLAEFAAAWNWSHDD